MKFISNAFYGFFYFLNLTDNSKRLSLTNILFFVMIWKFFTIPLAIASITQLVAAALSVVGLGGAATLYHIRKPSDKESPVNNVVDTVKVLLTEDKKDDQATTN